MVDEFKLMLPPGYKRIFKTPDIVREHLRIGLEAGMELSVQISKTKYLAGPRPLVLGIISGALRGAVMKWTGTRGKYILEGLLGVPKGEKRERVWYGKLHEYGMHGVSKKTGKAWGFPKRAFLDPALRDALPQIFRYMEKSIFKGFNAAGGTKGK